MSSIAPLLAPAGALRVAVWTVPYFALQRGGALVGIIPDLGSELARRTGVPVALQAYSNPAAIIAAFRDGALDVTILGITADRAAAIDFGPGVLDIQTTYLVPAVSSIASIAEVDRAGTRIAVPANSAQEAHLKKTLAKATLVPIPAEQPQRALDLLKAGKADAFSHVAPMLAGARDSLPGARILPGSYFNVPVAIGVAKGRAAAVAAFVRDFAEIVKASGFLQQAIDRAGIIGVVVAPTKN